MYILVFFWWGSFAANSGNMEFSSKQTCEVAVSRMMSVHKMIAGEFFAQCLKK